MSSSNLAHEHPVVPSVREKENEGVATNGPGVGELQSKPRRDLTPTMTAEPPTSEQEEQDGRFEEVSVAQGHAQPVTGHVRSPGVPSRLGSGSKPGMLTPNHNRGEDAQHRKGDGVRHGVGSKVGLKTPGSQASCTPTSARLTPSTARGATAVPQTQSSAIQRRLWAGQSNILVAVRVRPLLKHDRAQKSVVRVLDRKMVVIMDPSKVRDEVDVLRQHRSREKKYAFDHVFDPSDDQTVVYSHTTKFLVQGLLDGFNATVFAYGQTGAGKTYTMIGSEANPGIMVQTLQDLFVASNRAAEEHQTRYKVTVSFLEVYNENIRDLLSDGEEYLDLREDPIRGPIVPGITEVEVESAEEIMHLLHRGNAQRSQHPTAANEVSSRSHAVLQVVVENREKAEGSVAKIKIGKLSLVDLAGSERAASTKNRGVRLQEGANINKSLLALGNCINALGEKGNRGAFVPYRDSKLTRLLKDSLGGNCRTVMIANISASVASFEETLNTLKYANRAKNIKTNVQRNVLSVDHHISEYVSLIENLRSEISSLKSQLKAKDGVGGVGRTVDDVVMSLASQAGIAAAGSSRLKGLADMQAMHANAQQGVRHSAASPQVQPSERKHAHGSLIGTSTSMGEAQGSKQGSKGHADAGGVADGQTAPREGVRPTLAGVGHDQAAGVGVQGADALGQDAGHVGTLEGGDKTMRLEQMKNWIQENFRERMQLRRSLIELEDQNVQNSIEIGKRQVMIVQWNEARGHTPKRHAGRPMEIDLEQASEKSQAIAEDLVAEAPEAIRGAWQECRQLRHAIDRNSSVKRSIAKRLRENERQAEDFQKNMLTKTTGEDRQQLIQLQYRIGKLELENMQLEQAQFIHTALMKGKDLTIQKLELQLAMKDKLIQRQRAVLRAHGLDGDMGYSGLLLNDHGALAENFDAMTATIRPPTQPGHPDPHSLAVQLDAHSQPPLPGDALMHELNSARSVPGEAMYRPLAPVNNKRRDPVRQPQIGNRHLSVHGDMGASDVAQASVVAHRAVPTCEEALSDAAGLYLNNYHVRGGRRRNRRMGKGEGRRSSNKKAGGSGRPSGQRGQRHRQGQGTVTGMGHIPQAPAGTVGGPHRLMQGPAAGAAPPGYQAAGGAQGISVSGIGRPPHGRAGRDLQPHVSDDDESVGSRRSVGRTNDRISNRRRVRKGHTRHVDESPSSLRANRARKAYGGPPPTHAGAPPNLGVHGRRHDGLPHLQAGVVHPEVAVDDSGLDFVGDGNGGVGARPGDVEQHKHTHAHLVVKEFSHKSSPGEGKVTVRYPSSDAVLSDTDIHEESFDEAELEKPTVPDSGQAKSKRQASGPLSQDVQPAATALSSNVNSRQKDRLGNLRGKLANRQASHTSLTQGNSASTGLGKADEATTGPKEPAASQRPAAQNTSQHGIVHKHLSLPDLGA